MSYDVLWCFTSMSYHRHAENVLSKVDIACGQFVLYPCSDGAPQKCQWMPLCSVALSPHVLSLAKYLTMAFEKIHKTPIPPTANTTYCPATALCTWRIQNHQATCHRGCSFTHSASHHPCTPPPINPTGRFRGPWPKLFTASTAAPAARSCSTAAVWPLPAAQCSAVRPQAPKGSETSTAGGLHPVALHRPTPAAVGETAISGVKSVSFIFFNLIKIV